MWAIVLLAAALPLSAGKKPTAGEVELGKQLFFDTRLSSDGTVSCSTCHDPDKGFADGKRFSVGVAGMPLKRHTPHLYNLAWGSSFFWDGRASSLEEQALLPIQSPSEMNSPLEAVIAKLGAVAEYRETFQRVYPGKGIQAATIARSIASFERSLVSAGSAYDRYLAGEPGAMTLQAVKGMKLFMGRAHCSKCHSGAQFTDQQFHNTGVPGTDLGRSPMDRVGEFQMRPYPFFQMQRAFKTPGLRNVELTAPYMHDGSEATLEDVVRFYNDGGKDRQTAGLSSDVRPLQLSDSDLADLVAFLKTLTAPVKITPPRIP